MRNDHHIIKAELSQLYLIPVLPIGLCRKVYYTIYWIVPGGRTSAREQLLSSMGNCFSVNFYVMKGVPYWKILYIQ